MTAIAVANERRARLVAFVRRLRRRHRRSGARTVAVRWGLVLAVPAILLVWWSPGLWSPVVLGFVLGVLLGAVRGAWIARGLGDARLLSAVTVAGRAERVDPGRLDRVGSGLATWLEHERRATSSREMREWLADDLDRDLQTLPAAAVVAATGRGIGRVRWLLPLVLLLLLVWLLSLWWQPPWWGVFGGLPRDPGGSAPLHGLVLQQRLVDGEPPLLIRRPVADAFVTLMAGADENVRVLGETRTDAAGSFTFPGLDPGPYRVRVDRSRGDLGALERSVVLLPGGQDERHEFVFPPRSVVSPPPRPAAGSAPDEGQRPDQPEPEPKSAPEPAPEPEPDEPEPAPVPEEPPAPLLELPPQHLFLIPEFVGEGPTERVRVPVVEAPEGGGGSRSSPAQAGGTEASPPPEAQAETFARAAERAQQARHVPDDERPIVRRFFQLLREAAK